MLLHRACLSKGAGGKLHRHLATCMSSQTLHLAWGGQTTIKPKDITDNVHSCQMFQHVRKNPGSLYWRDGLGSPAKPALKPLVVVLPIEFAAVSLWTKITFSFNQPELKTNMIQTVIIIQDSIYT